MALIRGKSRFQLMRSQDDATPKIEANFSYHPLDEAGTPGKLFGQPRSQGPIKLLGPPRRAMPPTPL